MMTQTLRQSPKASAFLSLLLTTSLLAAQAHQPAPQTSGTQANRDISGMYTFLQEGEFVQINVEPAERQFVKPPRAQAGPAGAPRVAPATDGKQTSIQEAYDPPTLEKTGGALAKPRRVTGFVSRFGDLESDKGAFLDHFFTKGSLYANELSFTTKTVHGVWFEFKGKVERGTAKAPAEEGYYIIRGTLKRTSVDVNKKTSSQSREVVLKSFPDLDADEQNPGR